MFSHVTKGCMIPGKAALLYPDEPGSDPVPEEAREGSAASRMNPQRRYAILSKREVVARQSAVGLEGLPVELFRRSTA